MTLYLHQSLPAYTSNPKLMGYIADKHPTARFIAEIALPSRGGFTPNPGIVLWEPAPREGHPEYFAYYRYPDEVAQAMGHGDQRWVVVGLPNWDPHVEGILTQDDASGKRFVTISRWRHDLVYAPGSNATIDGGRDYTKVTGSPLPLTVVVNLKDRTVILDGVAVPYEDHVSE